METGILFIISNKAKLQIQIFHKKYYYAQEHQDTLECVETRYIVYMCIMFIENIRI